VQPGGSSAGVLRSQAPGVLLSTRTSFKIGGVAREFHIPTTIEELRGLLRALHKRRVELFILGGGANTLFPDGEYQRPVVSTEKLRGLTIDGHRVRAECGVPLNVLINTAIRAGLAGLEGFVGIPGTAGGAVRMNAGGAGWSFGDRVLELGLLPLDGGPLEVVPGKDVAWGYRTCGINGFVVAHAVFDLTRETPAPIRERSVAFMKRKAATQPLRLPSAGCIFRNPEGSSAGKCIEQLGLKGLSRGGARVSERHANFIVNATGRARASDVLYLVEEVRSRVERELGVRLETEIVLA